MSKFFQALERAEREHFSRGGLKERNLTGLAPDSVPQPVSPLSAEGERPEPSNNGEAQLTPRALPGVARGIDPHLVSFLAPTTFEAEQYRRLRQTVEQLHRDAAVRTLVAVSSPAVGDGKTTTAINLAGTLAQSAEARVLLVDLDLRRPSIARSLSIGNRGLSVVDAIADPLISLEAVALPYAQPNLAVLLASGSCANPYEILKSPRLGELLEEARQSYDYVIIDTPPLIPFPDCQLIGRWVDGFFVVVAAHRTPRKLVEEATNVIDPDKILGLIFNCDDHPVFGYYPYYTYDSPGRDKKGFLNRMVQKIRNCL
jgi:capsular exopolysaccharide synthesis family protein